MYYRSGDNFIIETDNDGCVVYKVSFFVSHRRLYCTAVGLFRCIREQIASFCCEVDGDLVSAVIGIGGYLGIAYSFTCESKCTVC